MPSEKQVQDKVVKWLRAKRIWHMKVHGGPYQKAGVPDLLIIYDGVAIFVELKAPGKKPTVLQERVMDELRQAGAIAFWGDDPAVIIDSLEKVFRDLANML